MSKKYLAYKGLKFTIEWYVDENGNSQSRDYLLDLDKTSQQKVFYLFKRMADFGKINDITKFRNEGDSIFAFKPQPERFLSFFVKDNKIIVTNAFRKKSNKLPKNEKEKALKYKTNYLKRTAKGEYYEK